MNNQQKDQKITDFFFELGMLKRQKHNGTAIAGVRSPDSLADHTARTAIIAYILAKMEGDADSEKTAMMCLVHDLPEMRIGDHHKISARYLDTKEAEKKVFLEQTENLPKEVQKKWNDYYDQKIKRDTKEGIIAQDADWLEMAVSAREFIVLGYSGMQNWIDNVEKAVETKSAKRLIKIIKNADPNDWWKGLKKMTYKKLTNRN
ncbi:MAG: HD domain-containing protein [bacterium]